jgi:lipid-A-disaccharide synthase
LVRIFIKIKLVSLVNIIAQKEIVPECIQEDATPEIIAKRFFDFYCNPFKMESTINALKDVKKKLGGPGAAKRAAEIVVEEISQSR